MHKKIIHKKLIHKNKTFKRYEMIYPKSLSFGISLI
jgi:hypothetical protein